MKTRRDLAWGAGFAASLAIAFQLCTVGWAQEGPPAGDRPPTVTLEVLDRTATEQSPFIDSIPDTALVAFRRTGGVEESLTVYYRVAGSATPGKDYPELPGEIVIPAGAEAARLPIEALDDDLGEPDETVVLGLIIPPGLPDVPPPYEVGRPAEGMVLILDDDGRWNDPPRVEIVTPPDGAVLPVPEELLIVASTKKDPTDLVLSVEFFVNGESLGVVEATTIYPVSPRDGPLPDWASMSWFRILWKNPTPGVHEIVALAKDFEGTTTRSEPVEITLLEGSLIPVVTVEATDPEGAEVGPNSDGTVEMNPAVFTLHRTGPTEKPLTVRIRLGGTAENGVDYQKVPYAVEFPAGTAQMDVRILPVDDELRERTEHVILALVAPPAIEIWPPPEGLYWVGRPGEAKAVILDNDEPDNLPPVVELLHPLTGEIFRAPAAIQLIALAADRDGEVVNVEFFDGDRRIGESQPDADIPDVYHLLWEEVSGGEYAIRAVATDNEGATQESGTARIKVVELHRPPVVTVETIDGEASEIPEGSLRPEDPAVFRVHRTGDSDAQLTVYYHMRGSAENGVDYRELPGEVTFGEGEESMDVYVAALPDELEEGPETVVIALMPLPCREPVDEPVEGERNHWSSPYIVGEPSMARAVILDDDVVLNRPPRVAITQPENGAVFKGPQDIEVTVAARDDDGWVSTVALYAGDELIDEMTIVFIQAPEPGQDQTFEFIWENVPSGAYTLRAKATDNQGAESWSGPVHIWVCPVEWPTVVSVVAVDPRAIEPGPDGEADPGAFAVYRRGDLSSPLTVYYTVAGTAKNGEDYEPLTGEVTIPAESEAARIPVMPLVDNRSEETETVVVELEEPACITIYPPPPECYQVGELRRAVVKILDRSEEPNHPPRIELVRPHEGDVFQVPAEIKMVAAACDRDGQVVKVEFFADGVKIHEWVADATLDLRPADVEACGYSYLWTEATVGEHVLHAVATDNDDASAKSQEVTVQVIEDARPPLVRIVATDPYASERPEGVPPNPATFKVHRTGSTAEDVTVWYSIGGTATHGEDYAELTHPVVIPAGDRSARLVIEPINDEEIERVETVVLRLEPSPTLGPIEPYHIGWPARACAVIVDNDYRMHPAQPLPEDGFHICLPGERGMPYRIEASEDMLHWFPVRDTLADEDGLVRVVEPEMRKIRHRFYRIRSVVMDALTVEDE